MQTSTMFKWLLASWSIYSLFDWTGDWMNKPIATWLWHTAEAFTEQETYLTFAEEQHVDKIYLQIDPSLKEEDYVQFIREANARGIAVYALGGSPSWTTDLDDFQQFITWVSDFQDKTALFAGIHADIEPYLLDDWATRQQPLIEQFFERISTLQLVAQDYDFTLEIDIPFWFDEIRYTNRFGQGVVSQWLIDHTDHVTLMAYRNHAYGADGINQIVKNELRYAQQQQKTITIALETTESAEGENVSFSNKSKQELTKEIRKIKRFWKQNDALTHIGIHDLPSWMALKNNAER